MTNRPIVRTVLKQSFRRKKILAERLDRNSYSRTIYRGKDNLVSRGSNLKSLQGRWLPCMASWRHGMASHTPHDQQSAWTTRSSAPFRYPSAPSSSRKCSAPLLICIAYNTGWSVRVPGTAVPPTGQATGSTDQATYHTTPHHAPSHEFPVNIIINTAVTLYQVCNTIRNIIWIRMYSGWFSRQWGRCKQTANDASVEIYRRDRSKTALLLSCFGQNRLGKSSTLSK